jgi:predicted dehydrogenase
MQSCRPQPDIRLITLDPDHFHAALVQKTHLPGVSPDVCVFAPEHGRGMEQHLQQIDDYNNRADNPTHWKETVYVGGDFLEEMISKRPGNVMITAGNNHLKTLYIERALSASINVLADKPMAIDAGNFALLEKCFRIAHRNNVLLYDVMTERFEITNILQREFSQLPDVYGRQIEGTADCPAIEMESVHLFLKTVSGKPLRRPGRFFDTDRQGEAIADVAVHLVDLIQWMLFPGLPVDYRSDIIIDDARRWVTSLSRDEFTDVTGEDAYPDFLKQHVENDTLKIFTNGNITYRIKGVNARVTVRWQPTNEAGCDTHRSIMRGSNARLVIEQGAEESYLPTLYVEPAEGVDPTRFENVLRESFPVIEAKYPGITIDGVNDGRWKVIIPETYRDGHEAHFGRVTESFIGFIRRGALPEWEIPCMISKYYTTTCGLETSRRNDSRQEGYNSN